MSIEYLVIISCIVGGAQVFIVSYYLLRRQFKIEMQRFNLKLLREAREQTLPLRLQAAERMLLFLERISPDSILLRVKQNGMTNADLQAALVSQIRSEYEHNLSQQLYLSSESWELIKMAKNSMIMNISGLSLRTTVGDPSIELAKLLLNEVDKEPIEIAIASIKKEIIVLL